MNDLKISENLITLRKKKKITQEELADFLGVTKASVSKWENGQCIPDVLLLPQMASYFDITTDELLGYSPQLSTEQINKCYSDFSAAFARKPFDEVLNEVRAAVKRYYSCYPFLLQICVLYLNHFQFAKDEQKINDLINEAETLCEHIINNCRTASICNDAISVKAVFDLQLGKTSEVIDALEEISSPARMSGQNDAVLINAYQMAGKKDEAISFSQITMYLHLLSLVGNSVQYMNVNINNKEACIITADRINAIAKTYNLMALHPNVMSQFYYQAAVNYCVYGEKDTVFKYLAMFERIVDYLLTGEHINLHADSYFTEIGVWIDKLLLGSAPPRDISFIKKSALQALYNPVFDGIRNEKEFIQIINKLS